MTYWQNLNKHVALIKEHSMSVLKTEEDLQKECFY